ncbi:hypothetical protein MsAg5_09540 [Methanosarcinaceae archaeon Ag5]|uniref:Uncharacterized protein n=1 Tax=Methanolapillus africanus TaxID=3028297 RepID=A0AAE4MJP5_9EURY|nr:hypothetical protein [Methanosarcinaceae archaeon Ag5]
MYTDLEKEMIEEVKAHLAQVKGVDQIFLLSDDDKAEIDKLEEAANGNVLMGMGEGDNQGVKEVFKKECIICFTTTREYVWPEPPNVIMMQGGEMVGFDCSAEDVCKYEGHADYLVMGTFIIDKTKIPSASGKPVVILPPKPYVMGDACQIKEAVLGSPSTPSDEYIRKVYNFDKSPDKGTFFLGFDLVCDVE